MKLIKMELFILNGLKIIKPKILLLLLNHQKRLMILLKFMLSAKILSGVT